MSNNNIGNIGNDTRLVVNSDIKINQSVLINGGTSDPYISTATITNMIAHIIE